MQEINENKLHKLINDLNSLHPCDDIRRDKVLTKMLYYCGDDEKQIVSFLSTLNLDDLVTMSEIFEDISEKLHKSKTFKKSLEEITSKYPDVDFSLEYC